MFSEFGDQRFIADAICAGVTAYQAEDISPQRGRAAARYLQLPSPSEDYKPINQHDRAWKFEPGIELGPDMALSP